MECPICGKSFVLTEIERHVEDCLDNTQRDEIQRQIEEDERLAKEFERGLRVDKGSKRDRSERNQKKDDPSPSSSTDSFTESSSSSSDEEDFFHPSNLKYNMRWSIPSTSGCLPGRYLYSCTLSPDGTQIFAFGGTSTFERDESLNELLIFDLDTMSWHRPTVKGDKPKPRGGHGCAFVGDRMYIFGGANMKSEEVFNDIWYFDRKTFEWTEVKINGTKPGPRFGHSFTPCGNKLYAFGGLASETVVVNELCVFDTDTRTWLTLDKPKGATPKEIFLHSAFLLDGKIHVFGGWEDGSDELSTELYVYDIATHSWSWPITSYKPPRPQSKILSSALVGRSLVVFTEGPPAVIFSTPTCYMAALDLDTFRWYDVSYKGKAPTEFSYLTATTIQNNKVFVIWSADPDSDDKPLYNQAFLLDTGMLNPPSLLDICVRYIGTNLDEVGDRLFSHISNFPERLVQQLVDYMYTISVLKPDHLTAVNLSSLSLPNVSEEFLEEVLPICAGNTALRSLDLTGAVNLPLNFNSAITELQSLETLNLMGAGIDDDLYNVLQGLPNLVTLNVSFCPDVLAFDVEDGAEEDEEYATAYMAVLNGLKSIKYLSMDGNNITNQGLQLLNGLTALQGLSVIGCRKLEQEGVDKLKKACPNLQIRW